MTQCAQGLLGQLEKRLLVYNFSYRMARLRNRKVTECLLICYWDGKMKKEKLWIETSFVIDSTSTTIEKWILSLSTIAIWICFTFWLFYILLQNVVLQKTVQQNIACYACKEIIKNLQFLSSPRKRNLLFFPFEIQYIVRQSIVFWIFVLHNFVAYQTQN